MLVATYLILLIIVKMRPSTAHRNDNNQQQPHKKSKLRIAVNFGVGTIYYTINIESNSSEMSSAAGTCKASCLILNQLGASNQVLGSLSLVQLPNNTVRITGTLHHLQPKTIHGISICQAGDLSNGAASCGPIFNPFGTKR